MKKRIIKKITKQEKTMETLFTEADIDPALREFLCYYFEKKSMTEHVAKRVLKHKHLFKKSFEIKIRDCWKRER